MSATELFEHYVSSRLSEYRGNFQFLQNVLQAGEMPDVRNPAVQACVEKLKRFLATEGIQEEDEFLLRFGLVAPGLYRGIRPPVDVLSPERGGFSDKRLKEAAGQVKRLRDALSLGRQFLPDLSSDTSIALQELSKRACPRTISDEEWSGMHTSLSPAQAAEVTKSAFKCLSSASKNVQDIGISLLQTLADCRRDGVGAATRWLAERRIYYPGSLYRGAPNDVASQLVQKIPKAEGLELNHLLLALAWSRGEIAQDAFLEWRTLSPDWTSELHVPVADYLHSAGWALDEEGARYDLISLSCHLIVKRPGISDPSLTVPCRVPIGSNCPICGGPLSWLFDFSALPLSFFSGNRDGAPRKSLSCLNCACFNPTFSRYSSDATAEWHPATKSPEVSQSGTRSSCQCHVNPSAFPPFANADPFRLDDASTLGGVPMWLQDAEYPPCPECDKPMQFLAQFYNLAMPEPEEGIFYAFFCRGCHVAAVSYQQT